MYLELSSNMFIERDKCDVDDVRLLRVSSGTIDWDASPVIKEHMLANSLGPFTNEVKENFRLPNLPIESQAVAAENRNDERNGSCELAEQPSGSFCGKEYQGIINE